jgi:transglutaminase-like putative cysteine protease
MTRFLKLREGWLTVGLLALMLFSVTLSIQQAQWSDGLSILTPITIVGLATGIVLAKVRGVPRMLLDLVGLQVGLITVLVAVASVMTDSRLVTIQDRVQDLLVRTGAWIRAALDQEMSDDLLVFILSLAVVAWVLAYSSAYFVFKSRQLWWALVPNGVALLINLSYSPVSLNSYIIIFMFSALLLMIRFNLLMQEERWQRERINYSPTLTWGFLWAGTVVSTVLALTMWFVPTTEVNSTLNSMWGKVNQPWVDFQNRMSALWSQVPGNQAIGGYSSFNDSWTMGGALNLSESVALVVKSKERLYWRAKTYDQYNGLGWKNTAPDTLHVLPGASSKLSLDANQQLISEDVARKEVTYTVQIVHPKDDLLFAVSRPIQLSTASRLNVSWRTLNAVYNVETTPSDAVPLELRTLLGLLGQAQLEIKRRGAVDQPVDTIERLQSTSAWPSIQQQVDNLDRRGLKVTFDGAPDGSGALDLRVSGEVPVYEDITAVHSVGRVPANQQYTATSLVTEAEDTQLREAPTEYDQWVKDRYLSLPATVPQRVRDLAEEIVGLAGAANPYDKAKAIETHLRTKYKYNTSIPLPPTGADRVDWFLFQGKEGYCEYYAGAMVVMLRHLGIPARMASGYAPGTYDAKAGAYIVKESAAHTWPEVYFPGYGWVEFEPTPSQAVVAHQPLSNPDITDISAIPNPVSSPVSDPRDDERSRTNPGLAGGATGLTGDAGTMLGVGLAMLAVAALFAVFTWWVPVLPWARKRSAVVTAGHYYGRMLGWARLLGIGPSSHQTPYEFGETVAREVPGTTLFTRTISRAYVRERFSREGIPVDERLASHRAWDSLRSRFLRVLPARQLKRAYPRRRR